MSTPRPSPLPPVGYTLAVSGSTSNLGAGFDAVGLALQIGLRLTLTGVADDGAAGFGCRFVDGPLLGPNAIERGYRYGLQQFAQADQPVGSIELEVTSEIPMRAGLGSSAAALVAGLRLAEAMTGPQPVERLLAAACRLEGHPDNTSASVLGGFVVACQSDDGSVVARSTPWPVEWLIVVATPQLELETKVARAALATQVLLRDAVFNLQRTALLVDAVHRRDPRSARAAFGDRLHQAQRSALVPGLGDVLGWSDPGLLGTFLSGAGPSIAAVVDGSSTGAVERVQTRFSDLFSRLGIPASSRVLRAQPPLER